MTLNLNFWDASTNMDTKIRTVCILSGGMDSTTLLYKLLAENKEVRAISFNYGQRHKLELDKAVETCESLNVPHMLVNMEFLGSILNSALTNLDMKVPHGHYEANNMKRTVVPGRNTIMASIAMGYASSIGFEEIAMGIHAGDHAIYPDCRPIFAQTFQKVALIANEKPIHFYTPFLYINKGDIALLGKKLGVNYKSTLTCYEGNETPCGKCGSCRERAEAFEKAQLSDPLIN